MVLLGLGAGIAFNPVLLAAMGDVEPHEAGLASGTVNTSFMMGGALGLAVLVAGSRPVSHEASSAQQIEALNDGFQVAFAIGAVFAALAAARFGGIFLRPRPMQAPDGRGRELRRSLTSPCNTPSHLYSPLQRRGRGVDGVLACAISACECAGPSPPSPSWAEAGS